MKLSWLAKTLLRRIFGTSRGNLWIDVIESDIGKAVELIYIRNRGKDFMEFIKAPATNYVKAEESGKIDELSERE